MPNLDEELEALVGIPNTGPVITCGDMTITPMGSDWGSKTWCFRYLQTNPESAWDELEWHRDYRTPISRHQAALDFAEMVAANPQGYYE